MLIGPRPDGSTRVLLDPPDGVLSMDIARDLVVAGRFGGRPAEPDVFPMSTRYLIASAVICAVVGLFAFETARIAGAVRRVRRRQYPAVESPTV